MIYQVRKLKVYEYKEKNGSLSHYHSMVIVMDKEERIITEKNKIEHIETTMNGKMTHNHLLQMNTRFRGIAIIFSILAYICRVSAKIPS